MVVEVYKVRFKDGSSARTDGVSIWIDDRLNEIEQRCAIMHEMIHIERGEGTCQPEYIEMEVRYETARRLLPAADFGSCVGDTLQEAADRLRVTRRVLMDRATTLTREQATRAGCFDCMRCPAIRARIVELLGEVVPAPVKTDCRARMVRFPVAAA